MNPALSVIFFTTLSGAGYGLLAWAGTALMLGRAPAGVALAVAIVSGLALASIGLLSSTFHLGKPLRAWRAFSQWRSSWLSREGVAAVLTYLPAFAIIALTSWPGGPAERTTPWLGLALAALAALTVVCTAMIYASLKPIPAWRHPLVVPVYLLFAAQSGLALALAMRGGAPTALAVAVAGLGLLLAAAKWRYWRDIDRGALPADPGNAVGLPGRTVGVFERPHTEANYITREMGFALARRHAARLRRIALLLFAGLPLLLAATALAWPAAQAPAAAMAALAVLSGAFVERWLFFAEARHAVMAYY
ncbi:dimethyl sulfoxide reductase anchor subunit family protein [Marilutibacter chinensis]|uniref:Dimethyl sulfoxide reductase anchor subunit n=1 Tax=Marilutibacter chinensis TaxID=2912247 RepID=A0ABS9HRG6_9GAMM|nr:DmsC/YnfH family molybdoenzyme membrane anchor subunit [Lysobacter chinensis]MCF7221529.1 dimethyl sulfoxide reductase anchor subunit [Lysobacter chinensis]